MSWPTTYVFARIGDGPLRHLTDPDRPGRTVCGGYPDAWGAHLEHVLTTECDECFPRMAKREAESVGE